MIKGISAGKRDFINTLTALCYRLTPLSKPNVLGNKFNDMVVQHYLSCFLKTSVTLMQNFLLPKMF